MLTRMTRMARMLTPMLTRMTRWLAGSHIIHTRNEHGASSQSSPKINRMLITRLICIK